MGELKLGEDLLITELRPPATFVGHSLIDLQLPRRYGVTVVAIRRAGSAGVILPEPQSPVSASDVLIVVAKPGAVQQMMERT